MVTLRKFSALLLLLVLSAFSLHGLQHALEQDSHAGQACVLCHQLGQVAAVTSDDSPRLGVPAGPSSTIAVSGQAIRPGFTPLFLSRGPPAVS